jgi:hypothetical protein
MPPTVERGEAGFGADGRRLNFRPPLLYPLRSSPIVMPIYLLTATGWAIEVLPVRRPALTPRSAP